MVANLSQPLILDVLKATTLRDVKDKKDTIASLIKISCDRSERLLACRIPNLKLDIRLLTNNHTKIAKFNSNCDPVLLFKRLACQSLENTGLADASITQDYNLEEHIKVIHHALVV